MSNILATVKLSNGMTMEVERATDKNAADERIQAYVEKIAEVVNKNR